MKHAVYFVFIILFLCFHTSNLYPLKLNPILQKTSFEQEEKRAIQYAQVSSFNEAISIYLQLIKSSKSLQQKAALHLNLLYCLKAQYQQTKSQAPYIKELQNVITTYQPGPSSNSKSQKVQDPVSSLIKFALSEYKNLMDELIQVGINPSTQVAIRSKIIEDLKTFLTYKQYQSLQKTYLDKLATMYVLNKQNFLAASTYTTLSSLYEKNLKNQTSKSLYIDNISKSINLLQSEINWKNPFLAIGYSSAPRSIRGLPSINLNKTHKLHDKILNLLLLNYLKLVNVKPDFVLSFNLAILQYYLNQKDNSFKIIVDLTTKPDTPYDDFCMDVIGIFNFKKDYYYLVEFSRVLIKQNKSAPVTATAKKHFQTALPLLASMYVNQKDYTRGFSCFVEFYKTFPEDPRGEGLWPTFITSLDGTSDHKGYEDWCSYYLNKHSTGSPHYQSEKTKDLLLRCIKHATDTTYDTDKINFSYEYLKRFPSSVQEQPLRDDLAFFLTAKGRHQDVYKLYQPLLTSSSSKNVMQAGTTLLTLDSKYGTQASGIELTEAIINQQSKLTAPNNDLVSLALSRLAFIHIENQELDEVKKIESRISSIGSSHPDVAANLTRIRLALLEEEISKFLDFETDNLGMVDPQKMLDTEFKKYNTIKNKFDSVCNKNPSIYCSSGIQSVLNLSSQFIRRLNNIDQSQISAAKLHDFKTKKFRLINTLNKIRSEYEDRANLVLSTTISHPQVVNSIMFASSGDFNFNPLFGSPSYGFIEIKLDSKTYYYELGSNRLIGKSAKPEYFIQLAKSSKLSVPEKTIAYILSRNADQALKTIYSYLKSHPKDKQGFEALFLSLLVSKRYALSEYYASLYNKYYSATVSSLNTLAISKCRLSDLNKADIDEINSIFQQALKLSAQNTVTNSNLAKFYLETSQASRAAGILTKIGSGFTPKIVLEVQSNIIFKKYDQAMQALKALIKTSPSNIEALYKKAVIQNLLGHRTEAIKELKTLRQKPSLPLIKGRIDSLLFRLEEKGEVSL